MQLGGNSVLDPIQNFLCIGAQACFTCRCTMMYARTLAQACKSCPCLYQAMLYIFDTSSGARRAALQLPALGSQQVLFHLRS